MVVKNSQKMKAIPRRTHDVLMISQQRNIVQLDGKVYMGGLR